MRQQIINTIGVVTTLMPLPGVQLEAVLERDTANQEVYYFDHSMSRACQ